MNTVSENTESSNALKPMLTAVSKDGVVNKEQQLILENWFKERIDLAKTKGEKIFLGVPEKWFENMWHCCNNGHVNDSYLKSELFGGAVCFDCYQPSHIFPNDVSVKDFRTAIGK